MHQEGSVFGEIWFWLLILGVFLIILGVIAYEYRRNSTGSVPVWAWLFFALGAILFFIGIIIAGFKIAFYETIREEVHYLYESGREAVQRVARSPRYAQQTNNRYTSLY